MKFMYWLSRLFNGSVRADEKRSPQVSEGGSLEEANLVKRSEAQKKGKFIINVSYRTNWFWLRKEKKAPKSRIVDGELFIPYGCAIYPTWKALVVLFLLRPLGLCNKDYETKVRCLRWLCEATFYVYNYGK